VLVRVPGVLSADQLTSVRALLVDAPWGDGRVTAGYQSAKVKANLQLPEDCEAARRMGDIVLGALERSALFISAILPRQISPPLFNRYEEGMSFGNHVDNAVRQVGNTPHRIRTDVSATLFLSAPEDYDGGELIVEDTFGAHSVKLAAGDMVVYPASSLHRVAPVTRGARLAAFFWVQSMVRDDGERAILFDLDRSIASLARDIPDNPNVARLTACYHNLVRRWAEI
jgi:PKHD-type hydroxylase